MAATTFRRKDPVVKAVRRSAAAHLDGAIAALTGSRADREAARREVERLGSLLRLVQRPLGSAAVSRERRVLQRALQQLAPREAPGAAALRALAAAEPAVDVGVLLQETFPEGEAPDRPDPDPEVLRLLADLAEVRMRARYWHLPAGGFAVLAPGLSWAYRGALKAASAEPSCGASAAWRTLGDQVQLLERAWPEQLAPLRKSLRAAQKRAEALSAFAGLAEPVGDHPQLRPRLDAQTARLTAEARADRLRLLAESPAAFVKRLGAYWTAWRGEDAA